MTSLFEAYNNTNSRTFNGARTNASSLNKVVDFFFLAGASRGKDITPTFAQALAECPEKALRVLQWMRDVRGGAGERQLFRDCLVFLEKSCDPRLFQVIYKVPEIGRWDDLLVFNEPETKEVAYSLIQTALADGNGLCAKWMPRKGKVAVELTKFLGLTPKQYRKLLVGLSNTVEQKMCAKEWFNIDFGKLPSLASARYQKAFTRNAEKAYNEYKARLVKGEAKVNASAVYPYDVLKSLVRGDVTVAEKQWEALPNYMEGVNTRILPVIDLSGSMQSWGYYASSNNNCSATPLDIAISLGFYISERNVGTFKDVFMNFTDQAEMHRVSGTLSQRMQGIRSVRCGYSTNVDAIFDSLLAAARRNNVPESEMPETILVLSDMEFNPSGYGGISCSATAFESAKAKYERAGYKRPNIVWWNLNGREGNTPVTIHDTGTALVSGFSPAIMKSLLGGEQMTPEAIMNKTIMIDRYDLGAL